MEEQKGSANYVVLKAKKYIILFHSQENQKDYMMQLIVFFSAENAIRRCINMGELPINQVLVGNCLTVMAKFPQESVDFAMFSPPYKM